MNSHNNECELHASTHKHEGVQEHGHEHACGCHEHGESDAKRELIAIGIGAALFIIGLFLTDTPHLIALLLSYVVLGGSVLISAVKTLFRGNAFDESLLMSIATIGALCIGETSEAVVVMLFYRVGEFFQDRAVAQSRRSIKETIQLRPDKAHVMDGAQTSTMDPSDVAIGSTILVKPGERIPLDGTVLSGESQINNAALTGESVPVRAHAGSDVLAGGINETGVLTIRTTREAKDSAISRIMQAVEDAVEGKPQIEKFITRFSRVYTPVVVGLAVLIALVPLILGLGTASDWIYRALLFLVISCPCALVLSVPLTFFAGLARASSRGIVFKGANYMEVLANIRSVALDKTGTLTKGVFKVQSVLPVDGVDAETLIHYAAAVERMSTHPIAKSICERATDAPEAQNIKETAGQGVSGTVEGHTVLLGNRRLLQNAGIDFAELDGGTVCYIAIDGRYSGAIIIADELKQDAKETIQRLNALTGYTAILTGDAPRTADAVVNEVGASVGYAGLMPEDKLACMRTLRKERGSVLFVGDGINDAPVLAGADIGMAIGLSGTDTAVEAADVVLLTPSLEAIADSITIARRTMRIARQNILFAIAIKVLVMILGVMGIANMWMGVFADVGAALLCVLHAMGLLAGTRKQRVLV